MNENKNYWWKDAVIYEVYVDKFAGDFKGMIGRLDYLENLGINCIWLLPHYPSPMVDDGYDVSDYRNVRSDLGSLEDFKSFMVAAHGKGIKVIVDLVLNHVSIEHPWFLEAKKSADNPRRDYFLWSKTGEEFKGSFNPFSHMVASNWKYNPETDDYYFATFFPEQADLNWDNPEVFNEIIEIIDFWAGIGVDGFRLDAVAHLIKREGTPSVHQPEVHRILKDIRRHLEDNYPGVIMLAEASGRLEKVIRYFGEGDECHMAFNFPLMANIYLALKRSDIKFLKGILEESSRIPENCQWATFVSNHDEITLAQLEEKDREEVISWLDPANNFSFTGGSGVATRLGSAFNGDQEMILAILNLLFSLPGSPVIYYGSEIGMKNIDSNGGFVDSRKYVRGKFDWDEAEKQLNSPDSLLNGVRQIIRGKPASLRAGIYLQKSRHGNVS